MLRHVIRLLVTYLTGFRTPIGLNLWQYASLLRLHASEYSTVRLSDSIPILNTFPRRSDFWTWTSPACISDSRPASELDFSHCRRGEKWMTMKIMMNDKNYGKKSIEVFLEILKNILVKKFSLFDSIALKKMFECLSKA